MMFHPATSRRILTACLVLLLSPFPADRAAYGGGHHAQAVMPSTNTRTAGVVRSPADGDVLLGAMVDELERSKRELVLADLPRPYFIQYRAQDRLTFTMSAAYGGLLSTNQQRSRNFRSQIRVGSYELDNTVGGSSGSRAMLPLDDDYLALRHAMWQATDRDYKRAVESLTRKRAYLEDKNIEDRPDDFGPATPVVATEPRAEIAFNPREWEGHLERLSARFKKYPRIQDSGVDLFAGAVDDYIINSEGTRLRTGDTGVNIRMRAEIQGEEGMVLSDALEYLAERLEQLPSIEEMLADIDRMCAKLIALSQAEMLEHYTGPVLFEPLASAKVFQALLADGVSARPVPLGSHGQSRTSLEKKLGLRILPRSFQVYDDPREDLLEGTMLAGHYTFDDEAVPATRVNIVENGILRRLLASRAPTRKVKQSTGHGRGSGIGPPRAAIGCLYISDDDAVSADELKQGLIEAAREEGLAYGLRVESMWPGGNGGLGSPIYAYKVYVEDGREEMVRGLEFLPVRTRILKRILAASQQRQVYNSVSSIVTSIVAPAILLEEVELTRFEEEFDKLPILKPPATRKQ